MSKERIEHLKKLIRDNKAFNKEYKKEIKELESKTVAGWYKDNSKYLSHITKVDKHNYERYGFDMSGVWHEFRGSLALDVLTPATYKEVETALITEAKRRGFKEGARYLTRLNGSFIGEGEIVLDMLGKEFRLKFIGGGLTGLIFSKGKWAEIIKTTHVPEGNYTTAQLKEFVLKSENK